MCIKQYNCVNQSNFLSVRLPHSTLTHRILIRAKITIPREDYYDYCLWWIHTSPDEKKTNRFGSEEKCELLHFYVINVPKEHIDWAWIWVKWMGFESDRSVVETEKRSLWNFSSRLSSHPSCTSFHIFWKATLNVSKPTDIYHHSFIGFAEHVFLQPDFNCFLLFILRPKSHFGPTGASLWINFSLNVFRVLL